jgi:hypothetical protein
MCATGCPVSNRAAEGLRKTKLTVDRRSRTLRCLATSGFAVCSFLLYWNDSTTPARPIHSPRLVMLDQSVKNLLRRQAFVSVDRDGRVADG